jgi:hypothetical protein
VLLALCEGLDSVLCAHEQLCENKEANLSVREDAQDLDTAGFCSLSWPPPPRGAARILDSAWYFMDDAAYDTACPMVDPMLHQQFDGKVSNSKEKHPCMRTHKHRST